MKTKLSESHHARVCSLSAVVASLLLGQVVTSQAQSPVGSWDCISSGGGQSGLLMLNLNPDNSLDGATLLAPSKTSSGSSGRNIGGDTGRGTDSTGTNTQVKTFIFGFGTLTGQWNLDSKSNVIGFFSYDVVDPSSSNTTLNTVSFTGKAVPGKRLTLVGSTTFGKISIRGIPFATVTNVSGGDFDGSSWFGTKTSGGIGYQEFFQLTTVSPNIYGMDGQGPGYTYSFADSTCMISQQKKIGFAIVETINGTNTTLRASVGSFKNGSTVSAKTKGIISPDKTIKFDATKY